MARIITTLHLSDIQKEVLAKIKAAQNPHMAFEVIQSVNSDIDNNFVSARDTLGNLGLLYVADGELEITEKGEEEMTRENLTDETGALTEFGQQLATIDRSEKPALSTPQPQVNQSDDMDIEMDDMDMEEDPFKESFSLIKDVNKYSSILKDLDTIIKK